MKMDWQAHDGLCPSYFNIYHQSVTFPASSGSLSPIWNQKMHKRWVLSYSLFPATKWHHFSPLNILVSPPSEQAYKQAGTALSMFITMNCMKQQNLNIILIYKKKIKLTKKSFHWNGFPKEESFE